MRGWGMMRMEGMWRGDVHEGEGRLGEGEGEGSIGIGISVAGWVDGLVGNIATPLTFVFEFLSSSSSLSSSASAPRKTKDLG